MNNPNINLVNERFGVAEPTLYYVEPITTKIFTRLAKLCKGTTSMYKRDVTIKYPEIRPYIKNRQMYAKFPVVGIELDLSFEKLTPTEYETKFKFQMDSREKRGEPAIKKILVGGSASGFGNRNWQGYSKLVSPIKQVTDHGIILNIGIDIYIHPSLDIENKKDAYEAMDAIKGVLWHELNHAYESYNLLDASKGRPDTKWLKTAVTYASVGANSWKFPKFIYDFWEDRFTYYIYFVEPYEVRAEIQELAYHINKYGLESAKKTTTWQAIEYMEKFNPDKFYQELLEEIKKYPKYIGTERAVARRLKDMWITVYKTELKSQKQKDKIDLPVTEKMRCPNFIKLWDKKFKDRAKYMRRKINIIASHTKTEKFI